MSTTLGDSGILNWKLGTLYEKRIVIDEPYFDPNTIAMGARLVFALVDQKTKTHVLFLNKLVAEFNKVVILAQSYTEANKLMKHS